MVAARGTKDTRVVAVVCPLHIFRQFSRLIAEADEAPRVDRVVSCGVEYRNITALQHAEGRWFDSALFLHEFWETRIMRHMTREEFMKHFVVKR